VKLDTFLGINNIADPARLQGGEMTAAENVDIGARGELLHKRGFELLRAGAASSVHVAPFGVFALFGNDLLLLDTQGNVLRPVYDTLGYTRVWYVTLPDGRVGFSNGLINGIASATETSSWGVPTPVDAGTGAAGDTQYQITYVRLTDGLEGPPAFGGLIDLSQAIIGLPALTGYAINIYAAPYGEAMFLLGSTTTDTFDPLGRPLGVQYVERPRSAPPVGTVMAAWRSRVLIAQGNVLWATQPYRFESAGLTQDFVQLPAPITGLFGTAEGIFVGTTSGLYFLEGATLDTLILKQLAGTPVVLGSMIEIDQNYLDEKVRPQSQQCAVCLVGGFVTLLSGNGQAQNLTAERYAADTAEVYAAVRVRDGVGQYVAAPA
jgi:hypothetical protein